MSFEITTQYQISMQLEGKQPYQQKHQIAMQLHTN